MGHSGDPRIKGKKGKVVITSINHTTLTSLWHGVVGTCHCFHDAPVTMCRWRFIIRGVDSFLLFKITVNDENLF